MIRTGSLYNNAMITDLAIAERGSADFSIGSADDGLSDNGCLAFYLQTGIGHVAVADLNVDCPGDTNNNRIVNFEDLNTVLSQFGQSGPDLAGNLNCDNLVNFGDLNEVLSNFGAACDQE